MSRRPAVTSLQCNGLVNARDLGGLPRADGSTTPHGVFFRSENVDQIASGGWQQIRDAGIRTIVDLRQPRERDLDTQGDLSAQDSSAIASWRGALPPSRPVAP